MENTKSNSIHANQVLSLRKERVLLFLSPLFVIGRHKLGINNNRFSFDRVFDIKIPFCSFNFLLSPFLLPILLLITVPLTLAFCIKYKVKTIHCRNLLSSVTALVCKKVLFSRKLNIVSDFRGLYSEEGVILGRWKYDSLRYKFWKYLEKVVAIKSNTCSFVSKRMMEYYSSLSGRNNGFHYIPAIVDTASIFYSAPYRKAFRDRNNIDDNETVYIYLGSYGQWHSLECLFSSIDKHIKFNSIHNFRVFILSSQTNGITQEQIGKYNIKVMRVKPSEVCEALCGADIGVLPGSTKGGISYNKVYQTMISSKLEEYLCSGLQVLVNDKIEEGTELLSQVDFSKASRKEISDLYSTEFSLESINKKYSELYE